MRILAALLVGQAALALATTSATTASYASTNVASSPLPVVGVVGSDPHAKLVALDPRSLRPLRTPKPLGIRRCLTIPCERPVLGPVLSPDGRRIAVVWNDGVTIVERRRLVALEKVGKQDMGDSLLADVDAMAWAGPRSFIFTGEGKFGLALYSVNLMAADTDIGGYPVRTRRGWAVVAPAFNGRLVVVHFSTDEVEIPVDLPSEAGTIAAYDAHRNRLFILSDAGRVAIVDLGHRSVSYRALTLPPELGRIYGYDLSWAGDRHLVLAPNSATASASGVWAVDTTTWKLDLVDSLAPEARVSTHAVVTWVRGSPSGITVYGPDGKLRFRALAGRTAAQVGVTGRYAYVDAGRRFSVDLREGTVTGPLRSRAQLVLPDLLDLP